MTGLDQSIWDEGVCGRRGRKPLPERDRLFMPDGKRGTGMTLHRILVTVFRALRSEMNGRNPSAGGKNEVAAGKTGGRAQRIENTWTEQSREQIDRI